MQSQIIFFGTAGDSFVLSKLERTAGGFLVQTKETQLHINPGPGALFAYSQTKTQPQKTTAVVVTDNTLLHGHDANALLDIITVGCFDTRGLLFAAKTALRGNPDQQPIISQIYQNAVEKTIVLQDESKLACNDVHLFAFKIKNRDLDAIGLKIVTDDFSLGYTGKTKYTTKLRDMCKDVEILIIELPLLYESKTEEGLCVEEAQRLIGEIKPQLAVLTGFGMSILKEDILELTRNMQKQTGIQVIAAKEGFSFDPTFYAVKLRQKRLQF